jgi:hypothetical protein
MRFRIAAILAALLPVGVGFSPAANSVAGPMHPPSIGVRHSTSSNWAGYAAYGSAGRFSSATATWVQPSVNCTSQNSYSAYWVGLDGYNTTTVEQLGTEADCANGTPIYSAWFEMYPHVSYNINNVSVSPGDSYTASVVYTDSGSFVLTLKDISDPTRGSFTTNQKLRSAKRASAEVIVEAPWSGGVLPLANFGTADFTGVNANGSPMGTFSALDPMTMDDRYGMVATPSSLTSRGTAFSVTWSSS